MDFGSESDLDRRESVLFDLEVLLEKAEVASEEQAKQLLEQAAAFCTEKAHPDLLLWKAELDADRGLWQNAETTLRTLLKIEPSNLEAKSFLVESLIRLDQRLEATQLLENSAFREEKQQFALRWLKQPERRLKTAMSTQGEVLHPLYGTENLSQISLDVYGEVADQFLFDLIDFHKREFPGSALGFERVSAKQPREPFEELRDLVDSQNLPHWVNPNRRSLIFTTKGRATAYSSGIGSDRVAVVKVVPGDPFQTTVAAHEIYHCILGLQHSNGLEGPQDFGSVMGTWGVRAPLKATYICASHQRFCTTKKEVQGLVDAGDWQRALELDPYYLALYKLGSRELVGDQKMEAAAALLESWFERDPGPESCAELAELYLRMGECPKELFTRTRGYGEACNTHLYQAQACLNAQSLELALECLRIAEQLDSDNLHTIAMLGRTLKGLGKDIEAEFYLAEALLRVPEWEQLKQ